MISQRLLGAFAALLLIAPGVRAQTTNSLQQYLASHETRAALLARAATTVRADLEALRPTLPSAPTRIDLYLTAFDDDLPASLYPYRTRTCIAVLSGLPAPSVICDAEYVTQIELAVRGFEDGEALVTSDRNMLRFALASTKEPRRLLSEFRASRRLAPGADQSDEHIGSHLSIALLFIVSHEVGHLLAKQDFFGYETPTASTDAGIRRAVVMTCRHAEEFYRLGFGLPGLESFVTPGSESRQVEQRYRAEMEEEYAEANRRVSAEDQADQTALTMMFEHLARSDRLGPSVGLERQHLIVETLFSFGVYSWYRDLAVFAERVCGSVRDSGELSRCMLADRSRYVATSRLFGDVHTFGLVRSIKAVSALLRQRLPEDRRRSIWASKDIIDNGSPEEKVRELQRSGDMQRETLLRIIMDTPVKFAYVACATGWLTELDARRGRPQAFGMTFEPIEQAVARMRSFP